MSRLTKRPHFVVAASIVVAASGFGSLSGLRLTYCLPDRLIGIERYLQATEIIGAPDRMKLGTPMSLLHLLILEERSLTRLSGLLSLPDALLGDFRMGHFGGQQALSFLPDISPAV